LLGFCYTRGYKELNFYHVEAENGEARIIYNEKSETSFDYFLEVRPLKASRRLIFSSERSGWKHYYLLDVDSGDFVPLTQGSYVVTGIVNIDEKEEQLYFTASGKEKGHNVYLQQLYRVGLDGKKVERISRENGHHQVSFSPDGHFFVDNHSSIYAPTKTILRSTKDLQKSIQLSEADPSELEATGWKPPQTEIVKADDGQTDIYVAMWKPTNFDPAKSYPIIDATYTGPHTFRFPRSYGQALSRTNQSLAELGFVVVTVDGRGASGRSKAFRAHSYKRLGYGLVDHVHAIKELGKKYSWMDVEKVGIFGHSAGGYDAGRGMLLFPDFYKVAVASSGDHDHRMEKAWWPEYYMGWPVDTAYHNQSNITNASKLKGKLLLVHGGLDENVNPSATFKLGEALIRADKDFDMLIIPSQHHGYRGEYSQYFTKKRWNYFVEHLKGAKPIWRF
jgi:dipeptidyl-peptidase-4